jgi:hypothetical protein
LFNANSAIVQLFYGEKKLIFNEIISKGSNRGGRREKPLVILGRVYGVMVFNATFNNISVISWWSVLLVEETRENYRPVASH